MQTISRSTFTTVTTEGAILPADLLQRIVDDRNPKGLKPTTYHLPPGEQQSRANVSQPAATNFLEAGGSRTGGTTGWCP